ncbi:MAG: lipocalin family protein [Bacteroidales bacterium]|nr:lipocalin family protein [Bacteroidales bacterium]
MAIITLSCMGQNVDNSTVRSLQLNKYLGTWYEIARIDHSFEKGMSYTTAKYSPAGDGTLIVVNSGIKNGKMKSSKGKAKVTTIPGLMRVSFFGPFYSDYRVLMVTDDYQYALVGSKSPSFLWILSRTPQIPHETLESILIEAEDRGYDTDKLTWVEQDSPGVSWN